MFKLRLNPMVKQVRLWNTDDTDSAEIRKILTKSQPWHGQQNRVEMINRVRMWPVLTADPQYEVSGFYLTRTANEPQAIYQRVGGR
jgi:hypothetical protein